jgi:hypothetical protein
MAEFYSGVDRATKDTCEAVRKIFKKFNKELFEGKLPNPQITFQRRGRSFSFFAKDRWANKDGHTSREIALSPVHVARCPIIETMMMVSSNASPGLIAYPRVTEERG